MEETPNKSKFQSVKNFVRRHQVSITGLALCAAFGAGARVASHQHLEFLKEKGLYEEFFAIEDAA